MNATKYSNSDFNEFSSDFILIDAINRGEMEAFDILYHRYRDWTASLAFRFTQDHSLAMDVLQETFIYIINKFPGFTLTCQFKTLLYKVVRSLSINLQKKAHKLQSTEGEQKLLAEMAIYDPTPTRYGELKHTLSTLSDDHRHTLWLRFVNNYSLKEISEELNIPVGTVKSRLHYAICILKEKYENGQNI